MFNVLLKMHELNADGIDFHPIMLKDDIGTPNMHIYASYTKDEFRKAKWIPKSCYTLWKLVDGQKEYIIDEVQYESKTNC